MSATERAISMALQVNPELRFFQTSALTGRGMREWADFLRAQVPRHAVV